MFPIDLFHRQARATPDATAVEAPGASLSYRQLHASASAFAAALQEIDPEPGSRVGICCFNHVEHLIAWLGTLAAGKVWVPLYPKNKSEEIGRAVDFTGMTVVVVDPEVRELVSQGSARIVTTSPDRDEGTVSGLLERHAGKRPAFHPLPLDGTQAIKFTGGSTGIPKGVMQPYRSWNTNIATQIVSWNLREGDRYLAAAPITHGTSTYILPTLGTGGTIVLTDRPRPAEVLAQLANNRIATTFVPPTMIYMMMQEPGVEAMRFETLRNLVYGSAPMRSEEIERAQKIFGPVVASTYGQTEAPQIATMISADDLRREDKRASVGRETFLTRVAVVDGDGSELPAGEIGEIVIRGDLVMTGYWRQPEKTAETIRDGWLHTGDLGSFDEEGFLFIKGRSKDVVITGGFNVYPSDVEPVIAEHDAVADCAVFGVPDDKWGEAVLAAVELKPGRTADPDAIIRHVKDRLGSVKAPKEVVVYEQLPRNAYGKLQKQTLVDDFEARRRTKETV
ncbi:MAG: long-chain fatty acid--CoA ligase [Fulvimarina sp.]|nr:long-chain fatty acid--CoA ligase [Fulvimarina sp.]